MLTANLRFFGQLVAHFDAELNSSLRRILDEGVVVENDCVFLALFRSSNKHLELKDFHDRTGLEAFVNSLHIDDHVDSDVQMQSLLFMNELITLLGTVKQKAFVVIAVTTNYGVSVRFHTRRMNEDWIDPMDIDSSEEAILIIQTDFS